MIRSYFLRIVVCVPFMMSGLPILLKATEFFNGGLYLGHATTGYANSSLSNNFLNRNQTTSICKKFDQPLTLNKSYLYFLLTAFKYKKGNSPIDIVDYQAEDLISFDAKSNILSLHGASALTYHNMKLEAGLVALDLNGHTIHAKGTKDLRGIPIGNPVFTYKEIKTNKYGKEGSSQTRTFFVEKIWYNIDTKRALVHALLTKQEESIVKSKEIKKEDEETFYGQDLVYTTCPLAHPHFHIRTKRAKIIHDKQITTGPFRFYFDDVPTPLGYIFGTLFLEGKRKHGIIPPEIGESSNQGFYLRNGGYYINFSDYVDISFLGSIYSTGLAELKNELRYKKRYVCSGSLDYGSHIDQKEKEWSLKWEHKTMAHGTRSINGSLDLRSKSYKKIEDDDKKKSTKSQEESSGSLLYQDQLVGWPYGLTLKFNYLHNHLSNFQSYRLPTGSLTSSHWYPFRIMRSKGSNSWFHSIYLKHDIRFENQFKNAKEDPKPLFYKSLEDFKKVPAKARWNRYANRGIKHHIPLTMQCKLFEFINLSPSLNYYEAWYWLNKETKGPIRVPGFNRVYIWNFSSTLNTTLYHTHYFDEARLVQGFRIKMEPSVTFTYTPDFSKKYFEETTNESNKKKKKYLFKGLEPSIHLANRATAIIECKLHNTVELKVKKSIPSEGIDSQKKEKKPKSTTRKIFLLKNLDVQTGYDFQAKAYHLSDINFHIASEAKLAKIAKLNFGLTTKFDPYLSTTERLDDNTIKKKRINQFAWNYGEYLGTLNKASLTISINLEHYLDKQKKKKESLLSDRDSSVDRNEANQIDFETPWNFSSEFRWIYQKLDKYDKDKPDYTVQKYVNFNGNLTLVKKWKLSLSSAYNFTKKQLEPDSTQISIQRDLHCWQLSYQWHPLGQEAKYDFSLGVKANVLKALKLPRKRTYNKLN